MTRPGVIAIVVVAAAANFAGMSRSAAEVVSPAAGGTIAIVHAKAYTIVDADPVDDATIVMRDGAIVVCGKGVVVPAGARIVDAKGRIVTPGLMNAATQLGLGEVASDADTMDQSVDSGPLGAAFDVQYAVDPNSLTVQKARADGLSRALVFPGGSASAPISGRAALLHLVPGPGVLERADVAIFATVGGPSAARAGGSRAAQWTLLRNALDEARRSRTKGAAAVPADDRQLTRLDLEALQPVLAREVPLAIVAQRESDVRNALQVAADFQVRVVIVGGAEAWRVAPELAKAHVPVVIDPLAGLPMTYDEIGARRDNAALLAKAGVVIAFTVSGQGIYLSYDAGSALREAAGVAVANGLPYDDALRAVTVNPAQIWAVGDRYGTLERGRDADLVIWDGDPLEPSSAPVQVFVGGREVSLRTRQTELRDRYRPAVVPAADASRAQ